MRVDLHNHTSRCNHASGTMREYIQKAIELGIDVYGFSDHAPMEFDPKYRMRFDQMSGYREDVLALKEEFAGQIEILYGLEVDYLPGYIDERVMSEDVDYFIGSVHFLNGWGFDNPEFIGVYKQKDIDEIYAQYFDAVAQMAQSGLFDVVGHLDLIKVFNYKPNVSVVKLAADALDAIKEAGMVIELNSAGLRKPVGEIYPGRELLKAAYERGIAVTFGSDAHNVDQVGFGYENATALAKEIGYETCTVFRRRRKDVVTF